MNGGPSKLELSVEMSRIPVVDSALYIDQTGFIQEDNELLSIFTSALASHAKASAFRAPAAELPHLGHSEAEVAPDSMLLELWQLYRYMFF